MEDVDHDDELRYAERDQHFDERDFWLRFVRFFGTFMAFLLMVLFLVMEGDNTLAFVFMVCFVVGLAYFLYTTVIHPHPRHGGGIRDILTDQELHDMDNDGYDEEEDDDVDGGAAASEWMAATSFADTPDYVKSCRQEISLDKQPQSGTYKVVYNAVYFGKSIRSESHVLLTFQPAATKDGNGWTITGGNISGSTGDFHSSRPISDGFLNARGDMYWRLVHTADEPDNLAGTYRGWFDLRSNVMFDGEFQAGNAPPGRIVRMERIGDIPAAAAANSTNNGGHWGSDDVEMVTLGKTVV